MVYNKLVKAERIGLTSPRPPDRHIDAAGNPHRNPELTEHPLGTRSKIFLEDFYVQRNT